MHDLLGTIARTPDGSSAVVRFDRTYATDPADLWEAVTDPERLARWFAPVEGELAEGGEFTIHFSDDDVPRCRVTSCDAPHRFVWTWPGSAEDSVVRVDIEAVPDGARLLLVHERLPLAGAAQYGAGWDSYLRWLDPEVTGTGAGERVDWDANFAAASEGYARHLDAPA